MHRLHIALHGGLLVPEARLGVVLADAAPFLVERGEAVLRHGEALVRSLAVPVIGLGGILRRAFAIGVALADFILRGGVAACGGGAHGVP